MQQVNSREWKSCVTIYSKRFRIITQRYTREGRDTRTFFYICERFVMLCDENFMSHDTHAIKLTFKTMIASLTTLIHTLNWIKSFNFIDNLPYFFTKISNSRRGISLLEFPIISKRLREWNWEQNSRPAWHFPSPISLGRRKRVPESRELLMLFCHALLSLKVRAQTQHVGLHDAVENILNFIEWEETPHSCNPRGCNGRLPTN